MADPRIGEIKRVLNRYLPEEEHFDESSDAFTEDEFARFQDIIRGFEGSAGVEEPTGAYTPELGRLILSNLSEQVEANRGMIESASRAADGNGNPVDLFKLGLVRDRLGETIPAAIIADPGLLITLVDTDLPSILDELDGLAADGLLTTETPEEREVRLDGVRAEWQAQEERMAAFEGYLFDNGHFWEVPAVEEGQEPATEPVQVTDPARRGDFVRTVPTSEEIAALSDEALEGGLQLSAQNLIAINRAAQAFLDEAGIDPERGNDNFLTPERVEALRDTEGFDEFYAMLTPVIEAELYTDPNVNREYSRVIEAELARLGGFIHIDGEITPDNQISDDERMMAWLLINLAEEDGLANDIDVEALREAMSNHSDIGDNPFDFVPMRMGERRLLELVGQSDNAEFESNISGWSVIFTGASLSQLMGESDGTAPTSYEDLASQELYDVFQDIYDAGAAAYNEAVDNGQTVDAEDFIRAHLDQALATNPALAELNALLTLPSFESRRDDLAHLIVIMGRDGLDLEGFQAQLFPSNFLAEYGGMDNGGVQQYSRFHPERFEVPEVVLETLGVDRDTLIEAYAGRSFIGGPLVMDGADGVTYLVDVDVTTGMMVPYSLDETNEAGETMRDVYDRYSETYGAPMSYEARDELYQQLRGFDVFNFYATGGVGGNDTSLGYYSFGHALGIEQSLNALYYRATGDYLQQNLPAEPGRALAEVFNPPTLSVDEQRDVAADVLDRLGILDRFTALDIDVLDNPTLLNSLSEQYRQLAESSENAMGWREFMVTRHEGMDYLVFGRRHDEVVVLELPENYAATGLLQGLPQSSVNILGEDGRLRLTSSLPVSQAFVDAVRESNGRLQDELWTRYHVEYDRAPLQDALERSGGVVVADYTDEDITALRTAFDTQTDELVLQEINGRSYVALYLDEADGGGIAVLDITDNMNEDVHADRRLDLLNHGSVRSLDPVITDTQEPELVPEQTITPQ